MIYPGTVQIETTTACNAHCGFCPKSVMNAVGRMSDELIEKIVSEIASWDRQLQICPFLTNEPFADPRMFDILAQIEQRIPKACLTFFTNASLLNAERLGKLMQLRNVESVHCSLHHVTAEAYKAELGLSFDRTLENIRRLIEARPTFKVFVLRVSDGIPAHDQEFCAFCEQKFPEVKWYVAPRWNWKGDIPSTYTPTIDMVCPRHSSMCITATGKVALCCLDQNADYCLGDVTKETLLEVFNGAIRAKFANAMKRENTPCNRCNMR